MALVIRQLRLSIAASRVRHGVAVFQASVSLVPTVQAPANLREFDFYSFIEICQD